MLVLAVLLLGFGGGGCVWADKLTWGEHELSGEQAEISRLWTRQLDRKTRWREPTRLTVRPPGRLPGELAMPLVAGGKVFATTSAGTVSALDVESGKELWQVEAFREPGSAAPALSGEVLIAASLGGEIVGLNAATGEELWRTEAGWPVYGRLAARDGRFFVRDASGALFAMDPPSGKVLWKIAGKAPQGLNALGLGGPVFDEAGRRVFWGRWDGEVQAAEVTTGRLLWQQSHASRDARFSNTDLGMAVVDEFLYLVRFAGPLIKVRLSDGIAVWSTEGLRTARGPAASGRRAYVPLVDGGIAAVDAYVGAVLNEWAEEINLEWGICSQPEWYGPYLVCLTTEGKNRWWPPTVRLSGRVLALEPENGKLAWQSEMLSGGFAGVSVDGAYLAAMSDRAVLQVWKLELPEKAAEKPATE